MAIVVGFLIVLVASFFFCFQNVIVRVLFTEQNVLGLVQTGGFVTPTLQHSFLLMFMRMLLGVPLMALIASKLYSSTWKEIWQLRQPEQRQLRWQAIAGGVLMFLYLAMLYISIGLIPTGIALTLFFTYPVFTSLFAWKWFGDRPTLFRWSIMGVVFLGSALTMPHSHLALSHEYWIGISLGIASGVTYALYTIVAQKSFERLHPIPFTWLSFAITLVLSGLSLLLWNLHEASLPWMALWIGALLSAIFTFVGHIMNNFGIRMIGASTASMIGASNPALTVVLAWFTIQETVNSLQLMGVIVVTVGVGLLAKERHS